MTTAATQRHTRPAMAQLNQPTSKTDALDTDSLAGTIWARLTAVTSVCATTASVAVAELKLAVSGALLAVAAATLLMFMLFLTWAMLLIIAFTLLQQAGVAALPAMTLLLVAQLSICALLVLGIRYLLKQTRFTNTRNALNEASDSSANSILTPEST